MGRIPNFIYAMRIYSKAALVLTSLLFPSRPILSRSALGAAHHKAKIRQGIIHGPEVVPTCCILDGARVSSLPRHPESSS